MPLILQPYQAQTSPQMASQPRGQAVAQTDYMGAALVGVGDQMDKAFQRIKSREDAIENARNYSEAYQEGLNELNKRVTQEDFSRTEAVGEYSEYLKNNINTRVNNYRGSEVGKAALYERLESMRVGLFTQAAQQSIQQQRDKVHGLVRQEGNAALNDVRKDPSAFTNSVVRIEKAIQDMSGNLEEWEQNKLRNELYSGATQTAVEGMLMRDDIVGAEKLLDSQAPHGFLDERAQRSMHSMIQAAKREKTNTSSVGKMQDFERGYSYVFGGAPDQKTREQFFESSTGMNKGDRRSATGVPALDTIAQKQEDYLNGLLSPREAAEVELAVNDYTKERPTTVKNELGEPVTVYTRNHLPPSMRRLEQAVLGGKRSAGRNEPVGGGAPDRRQGAAIGAVSGDPMEFRKQLETIPNKAEREAATQAFDEQYNPQAVQEKRQANAARMPEELKQHAEFADIGLFGLGKYVAGPGPAIGRAWAGMPIIGDMASTEAKRAVRAEAFQNVMKRLVMDSLRTDDKDTASERIDIGKQFDIAASAWDSPTRHQNAVRGINEALVRVMAMEDKKSKDASLPQATRKASLDAKRKIEDLIPILNVPPTIRTPADIQKHGLKSGDAYIHPTTGEVRYLK